MALTQTQVYQIRHAASLGQAKLMAGAWGASDQQLADILRGSGLETILTNIAKQHEEAGTAIPKQSQDIIKLTETFPSKTMYTAWGGVATTPTLEITDKIRTAQSFSQAQTLAKSYGIKDTELSKILKGSWLEDIAGRELAPPVPIPRAEPPVVIPTTKIGITQPELDRIAKAKAAGQCVGAMKAYYAVKTYKVVLKDGSVISVEALDKETAERKAEDAGHDVAWVTKEFSWETPEDYSEVQAAVAEDVEREDGLVKLSTGEWVKEEFYDILTDELQTKLNTLGVDKYNKWLLDEVEIKVKDSGNQYLIDSFESGGLDGYNTAVEEYNQAISDAQWLSLYGTFKLVPDEHWEWFQETYADKLKDKKYMSYLESSEFRNKYALVIQPSSMSDKDYNLIKPYIHPEGFDSEAAYRAGEDNPNLAVNLIRVTNEFTLTTLSDETKAKIDKGEWTLLPYGQVIDTKALESMPPTYRNMVQNAGLVGYEAYQEKVLEWNKDENWFKNTMDAIVAQSVGLGQDVKNYAILQFSATHPEVKEGDLKPIIDPFTPGAVNVGVIGVTPPTIKTYTAEEAAEINAARADTQKYYKDMYDAAAMAAEEWMAQRPQLQAVYAEGFVDTVKKDPSKLKDPLLWTETMANTIPYTVATGLIVAGFMAGPGGLVAGGSLAFGITLSVEGHDIYKDAVAHGASHDRALELGNTYGAISAAIETLGDTIFVGALGIGAGAFSQSLGRNMAGNIVRGAARKYGWRNLTTGLIKDFVNQGGQEFFQEVVHNAAIKTVDENQALLENTANAFVSGVIGTAPFVLIPAGGQAIRRLETRIGDVRKGKTGALTPMDITPQMQIKILNKVFAPVSGFTVKTTEAELEHLKRIVPEMLEGGPVEYAVRQWEDKGRDIYEAGKNITVGMIDKKTVVAGKAKVDEVALAYNEMVSKVNEYGIVQLKLKQALQAISKFGLAKSKSQLETLNKYKKRAAELEKTLKDLKDPMVEAVSRFSDAFLKNSVGLEAEQKAEIREMSKAIVTDIDSVTTQLFGDRTALEIAKDIRELEGQIKVIEEEMSKGMTGDQLEGYGRLINILTGQVNDLVNELRPRYLAEGEKIKPDTKKLVMEVMSLQARLAKAAESLQSFRGSVLDYDVYRKGELAHEAEVLKVERDTFEAIQKTTEAIWGEEHYKDKLAKLNRALNNLVDLMKEANRPHWRVTGISFNIYDAIRGRRKLQALKKHIQALKSEAGKVRDSSLHRQAEAQVQVVETLAEELSGETRTELRPKKPGVKTEVSEQYTLEYSDADLEAARNEQIRREAESIVANRLHKLLDHAPGYVKKRTGKDLMDYLSEIYDAEYFKTVHDGIFKDLDDYLSTEKEEVRIKKQVEHQEWLQKMDQQIASYEAEADLAKDLRDEESGSKRRDTLDGYRNKAEQKSDTLTEELKERRKTRVAVAEREDTLTAIEKEKLEKIREKLIQEKLQRIKDKLKSEEKAKKLIETAKKGLAKEEVKEEVAEEVKEEAVETEVLESTKEQVLTRYKEEVKPQEQVFTKTALETATEVAVQTFVKTQTQEATQTQTETALATATQTALQEQTKTATEEAVKIATKIIIETVVKTGRSIRIVTILPILTEEGGKKYYKIPRGSIAWKQGLFWKYIPPPWRQEKPITIKHPPLGARFIGSRTPKETIQMIGKAKAKVPKSASIDLGVVDIFIENYGKEISFRGKGLETVVGHSLGSTTKGMSIPGTAPMKVTQNNVKSKRRRNSNKRKELVRSASAG